VTNVESWIWRLLFAVATPFTGGAMIIVYLLLWIFVPRESDPTAP
jgi:phage shock protein C